MLSLRNKIESRNGQNLLEYATIVGIIAVAMIAMSTYVFRATQATQQEIQEEFVNE